LALDGLSHLHPSAKVSIRKEEALNKIERVTKALKGEEVDRPPFSFWYHFGLQHMSWKEHATAETDFYRAYDLDFLKVMSDFPYPYPAGLEAVASEDDWRRVEPVDPEDECWRQQLSALSSISDQIGKEAMFIETIFSPWTTAPAIVAVRWTCCGASAFS
jgi:uroporphyrinogen decarboxylase